MDSERVVVQIDEPWELLPSGLSEPLRFNAVIHAREINPPQLQLTIRGGSLAADRQIVGATVKPRYVDEDFAPLRQGGEVIVNGWLLPAEGDPIAFIGSVSGSPGITS